MGEPIIYGPGRDNYGRNKKIAPGGCVKSDDKPLIDLSSLNIPATSVPPAEPTVPTPNLTAPLITDHVYAGSNYGPFSVCTYCQGHHAKHLYQSSAYVYQSIPYDPPVNPWFPSYPTYPIIYGTCNAADTGDGRPSATTTYVWSRIST